MARNVKHSRRGTSTKLSGKHQATIPVRVLAETGVKPGDRLMVRAAGAGRIVLERERTIVEELSGSLDDFYPPDEIELLRSEWR